MRCLCILLFIFISSVNAIQAPFVLIIIDTVSQKFVYLTQDSATTEYAGYDIDFTKFKKRINEICKGYDGTKHDWMAEMSIEKKSPFKERLKSVYACVDGTPNRNTMLPKIMKRFTNRFERNMPKKWTTMPEYNTFNCSDTYGRTIPMPLGVRRCYVQQTRVYTYPSDYQYSAANELKPLISSDYGTDRKPKDPLFEVECEESLTWQPFESNNDDHFLKDGQCAIRASFMEMSFFCCCYTDYKKCNVANVRDDGLTCPRIEYVTRVNIEQDVPAEKVSNSSITMNGTKISADELILVPNCYAKVSVEAQAFGNSIDLEIEMTDKDDDMCKDMYSKRTATNPCHRYERHCVMDTDPAIIFCCHFMASDVKENATTLLRVHGKVHKLIHHERPSLFRLNTCLRPFGDVPVSSDDHCIFFYDFEMEKFVNLQIDGLQSSTDKGNKGNIELSPKDKEEIYKFIKTPLVGTNMVGKQFYGRYRVNEPRTFECVPENSTKLEWQRLNSTAVPQWYDFTFVVFKCLTLDGHPHRCDDTKNEPHSVKDLIDDLPEFQAKYLCNEDTSDSSNNVISLGKHRVYDAFCFEFVKLQENDEVSYHTKFHRNKMLDTSYIWLANADKKNDDKTSFFCGITKNGTMRFCACTANEENPCNTGDYVKTFNLIAKQEAMKQYANYELEDGTDKRVCSLPNLENTADKCLEVIEDKTDLPCYFLLYNQKAKADIGCLREPNLSHRRSEKRLNSPHSWHNYQLCSTIEVPEDPGYRCVLKDNAFDQYQDAIIVCCCKSDTCTKAYTDLLQRDHFMETNDFIKLMS